jgi:hypothetical protein
MPAEGDLRSNGIERSGQIEWVQIPVVLLVVQAYYLLYKSCIADRFGHSLDDYYLASNLKVDCDSGTSSQVGAASDPVLK